MSHQSKEAPAFLTRFDFDQVAHHDKPEEHEEKEKEEYTSLEEALTS